MTSNVDFMLYLTYAKNNINYLCKNYTMSWTLVTDLSRTICARIIPRLLVAGFCFWCSVHQQPALSCCVCWLPSSDGVFKCFVLLPAACLECALAACIINNCCLKVQPLVLVNPVESVCMCCTPDPYAGGVLVIRFKFCTCVFILALM